MEGGSAAEVSPSDMARRFFDAYNTGRPEVFVSVLDPGAELATPKRTIKGHDEAAAWIKAGRGAVVPNAVTERVFERDGRVLALIRMQFRRRDTRELIQEADAATVFEFADDGLVKSWRMYEDPAEGLKAVGIGD